MACCVSVLRAKLAADPAGNLPALQLRIHKTREWRQVRVRTADPLENYAGITFNERMDTSAPV